MQKRKLSCTKKGVIASRTRRYNKHEKEKQQM
jgi:hypothetical protein